MLESFAQLDDASQSLIFGLAVTFGFLLLFPIVLGLFNVICRVLRLNGAWGPALAVGSVAGLFLAGSVYLDGAGILVPGEVDKKEERISLRTGSNWSRTLALTVHYTTRGARQPTTSIINVDEAAFDRLRPGSAVRVRYLPEVRAVARLEEQSTLSILPWDWLPMIGLAAAGLALVWAIVKRRVPRLLIFPLVLIWLGGLATIVLPTAPGLEPAGPRQATIAQVRQVWTITTSIFSSRRSRADAAQPYELAELVFTPAGRDQSVVAVDAVDQGSLPGLVAGGQVAITYPVDAPRQARLVSGTRTYWWKDWLELGGVAVAVVALFVAWRWLGRRAGRGWGRLSQRAEAARQMEADQSRRDGEP